MESEMTFRPRKSAGWLWLTAIGLLLIGLAALMLLAVRPGEEGYVAVLVSSLFTAALGLPFVVLAAWYPTMRYELGSETLTLRYGPVLTYRIPLVEIETIRRRNLSVSLWSSVRFPGIALFTVPYSDVGNVKMCATAAADRILLIDAEQPFADEMGAARRVERRVRGEDAVIGAEECEPALECLVDTVDGRIADEHPEVIGHGSLKTGFDGHRVCRDVAFAGLPEPHRDLAFQIGHNAAEMMGDDLDAGKPVEQARIDEPPHCDGGFVRPAESKPELVHGLLFGSIVGVLGAADRVQPNRVIELGEHRKNRQEFRLAERGAENVRVNEAARSAERLDGTLGLGGGRLGIVHRQTRDEAREPVRVLGA